MRQESEYRRVDSIQEALSVLRKYGEETVILAGGVVIGSLVNQRLLTPSLLLDISRISELKRLERMSDGAIRIGALVTHDEIYRSALVRRELPLLSRIATDIACERIRTRGTMGGSLCLIGQQGDPATAMLALEAEITLLSDRGQRKIPATGFYSEQFRTQLEPDEILTEILVRPLPDGWSWAFKKLGPREAMDFTLLSVTAVAKIDSTGKFSELRIAINGVAPTAVRLGAVEDYLTGQSSTDMDFRLLSERLNSEIDPQTDLIYSANYKRHLAGVILKRALMDCVAQTKGSRHDH